MIITTLLFIICFIAICLGCDRRLSEKRSLTDMMKFVTALLVVNGHLFTFGGGPHGWIQEMNIGPLCVSFFFFLSGYGLMCSYEKRGNTYLTGFLIHRLGRVIIPLITAYVVTLLVYRIVKGPIDWYMVFSTLSWGGPFLKFSWYVTEVIVLYLLFYVTMKSHLNEKNKIYALSLAVLLIMGVLIITKQPIWYIESLPAFIISIWFQKYEGKICAKISKTTKVCIAMLLSLILLTTFHWHFVAEHVHVLSAFRYQYVSYYIMNIVFITLVIIAMKGLVFDSSNYVFANCYYEIYLMQNCVMIALRDLITSFPMYWFGVMLFTIILAVVIHRVNSFLIRSLKI